MTSGLDESGGELTLTPATVAAAPAPVPAEPGLAPSDPDPAFDRLAGLAGKLLRVPVALVTLVEGDRLVLPGAIGLAEPWESTRVSALSESLCQYVVRADAPFAVSDVTTDGRLAPVVVANAMGIAYAGVPLHSAAGAAIGVLCVVDAVVRNWSPEELADLADLGALCSAELQLRQASSAAGESSRRAQYLIASMPVGYIAYDADWRVTTANDEAARIVNSTVDDLVGNILWDLFPATVGSEFDVIYRRVRDEGTVEVFEYFYPDPLNKWYEIRVQSDPPGLSVYFVDVTSRHEHEARSEEILASMPVGFVGMDENWRMISVNKLGAALAGSTVEDMIGRNQWEMFPALAGSDFERTYRRVAETGVAESVEAYYPEPLNAWYDVRVVSDRGRVSVYFLDVSQRHEMQALIERQAEHDRSVAQTLQQAMLTPLPTVDGLEIEARYLTATGTEEVGGDWYDAIEQPDGAVVLSLGDVAGHGVEAAATMGQLRAMLRGFLWDDDGPVADNVARLDAAMCGLDRETTAPHTMASLIAARIEAAPDGNGRTLRWTNAGHPPPIVIDPDGRVEVLTTEPELVIGVRPGVERSDHVRELPTGSILVLFTDGLIESRTSALERGIEELTAALGRHGSLDLDQLLDRVLHDLGNAHPDDDVAILAVRIGVREPSETLELPADPSSPQRARDWLTASARGLLPAVLMEHAQVMMSELVTNAVLHGAAPITVEARREPAGLLVTVHDHDEELPRPPRTSQPPDITRHGGRGLFIVDALASAWGVSADPDGRGKAIWFRLATTDPDGHEL